MGHAQRRDAAAPASPLASRCDDSPHCQLPPPLALRFGGLDGLWLHYGPIGDTTTPLAVHRAERPAPDRNAGGLDVETRQAWQPFRGCHLDIFALEHRPGDGGVRHVQALGDLRAVLWKVFAIAWCDDGGPYVSWIAPGLGLPHEGYGHFSGASRPTAATLAAFDRLADLLDGGRPRRGRPSRLHDPAWRDIAARALERKAAHPGLPWKDIATALNIPDRTLRLYRRILERERHGDAGLHLLDEGER